MAGCGELSEELRDGMEGRREQQDQRQGQEFGFHPRGNEKELKGFLTGKGLNLWLHMVHLEDGGTFVSLCSPHNSDCTPTHLREVAPWGLDFEPVSQFCRERCCN